jgi:hypothetical protein
MAFGVLGSDQEKALVTFPAICRKLKRNGILTDALAAAAASIADLIADVYAALRSGTTELYGPEMLALVRRFEQKVKLMEELGLITNVIAAALTTINTADASTDLTYLVRGVLTISYDATAENSFDNEGNYSYASTR